MSAADDLSGRHTQILPELVSGTGTARRVVEGCRHALQDGPTGVEFHPDWIKARPVRQPNLAALGLNDPEGRN